MNNLSFEHYFKLKEMAIYSFGKHKGKHINDVDRGYAIWMLNKIAEAGGNLGGFSFMADDGSGKLKTNQVMDALKIRSRDQKVAPTSVGKPIEQLGGVSAPKPAASTSTLQKPEIAPEEIEEKPTEPGIIENPETYMIPKEKISEYQKTIEDAFLKSNKHLVINALAGTGKSTVLKHLAGKFSSGQRWLYLVFNKKNQEEASSGPKAFPSTVTVRTSHSFLFNILKKTKQEKPNLLRSSLIPATKLPRVMDSDWFFHIVSDLENRLPYDKQRKMIYINKKTRQPTVSYKLKTRVQELTSLAKNYAINPEDSNAAKKIREIFNTHQDDKKLTPHIGFENDPGPSFIEEFIILTLEVLKKTSTKGRFSNPDFDQKMDYDDMIWWPTLHPDEVVWPSKSDYQVALIDEVQDFNEAQKVMIENLAKNGIRIIVVGDPHQAIYGWRGALRGFSKIDDLLRSSPAGAETHRLPVNYRSGKKIIEFVNKNTHVKDLVAGRDHEGKVNTGVSARGMAEESADEFHENGSLKEETAFISRTNAPLFGMAIHFLKEGVPFQILGSDFSKEILDFIYTVAGNGNIGLGKKKVSYLGIQEFSNNMIHYITEQEDLHGHKKEKEDHLQEIKKLSDALEGFIYYENSQRPMSNVQELCNRIEKIFKAIDPTEKVEDAKKYKELDRKRTVFLTTAHRSKGLEFERVNIIDNGKFPDGDKPDSNSWRDQEEHNTKYVAYTRATHTLNISDDKGIDDDSHQESYIWRKFCKDLLKS